MENGISTSSAQKSGLQLINKNFRPVPLTYSSLSENAVAVQLQEHMRVNGLFPEFQSAYPQDHSTETGDMSRFARKCEIAILAKNRRTPKKCCYFCDVNDFCENCEKSQKSQNSQQLEKKSPPNLLRFLRF